MRGFFLILLLIWMAPNLYAQDPEALISDETYECLVCHESIHPGIVAGWRKSRHYQITPGEAMAVKGLALKVSNPDVPMELRDNSVGCAECHLMRPGAHKGAFEHNGYQVHTVVSPDDCATCHNRESEQYGENIMAHAYGNLVNNPLYTDLARSINGVPIRMGKAMAYNEPDEATNAESCLYCHGTKLEVTGVEVRDTDFGEMEFPKLAGWPNQGSGRINLDGSKGSCTACHTRHQISMAEARKPYTCKECHDGPDVPAYKVYSTSKHGVIYSAKYKEWDFTNTPWTIGRDFTAPTCAACHISLLTNTDGEVVSERTHALSPRLPWRIFGLIYAHPQPKSPDTSIIVNDAGLPLPTNLDGTFSSDFLIDAKEMEARKERLQAACLSCHGKDWVDGHWARLENTIQTTNEATKTGTQLLAEIWEKGYVKGLPQGESVFDDFVEKVWSDIWLFHCNSIRFTSAIAGGGDYGVFADGRYVLNRRVWELADWLKTQDTLHEKKQ